MPRPIDEQATHISGVVRKTPGVLGGEACIGATRHRVSGLVQWRRLGLADHQILERHPDLSQGDLNAAWDYHDRNRDEIDSAILDDEEAWRGELL